MKLRIPPKVKSILEQLQARGYEAYAVGGCVRDSILGREPNDWDITTSARPEQVKEIFRRTVDTGIQHGTVTVLLGAEGFEVTTYRIDGDYLDGRHPESVSFTASLEEDLKRRDFTINAMAYNDRDGLVDLFDGMGDLQRHRIRCVGKAEERFGEDALRILRAVRFSAQLDFPIEEKTRQAAAEAAETLSKVSAERICTELIKLITSPHPEVLKEAWDMGITRVILPEFDALEATEQNTPYHCYNVGDHTLKAMQEVPADRLLRLTMLLHDIAKPDRKTTDENGRDHFKGHGPAGVAKAEAVMRRLKLDNATIQQVKTLITYHDWRMQPEKKQVRRAMNKVGTDLFPALMQVQLADALAQSDYQREEKLQRIRGVQQCAAEILESRDCVTLKQLAIGGRDLMQLGCSPGPGIGRLLQQALELVLEDPEKNSRGTLLAWAAEQLKK